MEIDTEIDMEYTTMSTTTNPFRANKLIAS